MGWLKEEQIDQVWLVIGREFFILVVSFQKT